MGQISTTFSKDVMKEMKQHYHDYLKPTPPHALFQAKTTYATITAYKSGKVLFQGKSPQKEAAKWDKNQTFPMSEKKKTNTKEVPDFIHTSHIGSDESGTGDYFGPVTACAVYIQQDQIALLKEIGIQDSKKLTDQNILTLSEKIINMNIPYSLMILHNEKYNHLQLQGWSQGKMKAMLHHACISNVLHKIGDRYYGGILIDQFCQPNIYKNHLLQEGIQVPDQTYFMTKAEDYSIAVATASIIARASFVKEMERLSKKVNMTLLKGASNKVDLQAASLIKDKGNEYLNSVAKVHFANTNKAAQLI